MNFAHVKMDIMMTEPQFAQYVLNSVKLVPDQLIIVSFVLKDMKTHQIVHGSQLPDQPKLKTYQLDLLKSPTVMKDVKLVPQTQMIVYLVMLTEVTTHFVHVMMDTMKQQTSNVNFVVTDVLNV